MVFLFIMIFNSTLLMRFVPQQHPTLFYVSGKVRV